MFPVLPLGCWEPSSWEPRWESEGLCCSRHVWQMEMDPPTGLSVRSGHSRAFFFLALASSVLSLTSRFLLQSNIWKWFGMCPQQTGCALGTVSQG